MHLTFATTDQKILFGVGGRIKEELYNTLVRIYLVYFTIACFICSCNIIKIEGIYSNYKNASAAQKSTIVYVDSTTNIYLNSTNVYAIDANTLLFKLKYNPKALVYIWNPNCDNYFCQNIQLVNDWCIANGYTFYLVADQYYFTNFAAQRAYSYPLFVINTKHYGTEKRSKYYYKFIAELVTPYKIFTKPDNFFYYSMGKLDSSGSTLN